MGDDKIMKYKLMKTLHESAIGGHSSQRACLQRIKSLFYWPKMKQDIIQYIQ